MKLTNDERKLQGLQARRQKQLSVRAYYEKQIEVIDLKINELETEIEQLRP